MKKKNLEIPGDVNGPRDVQGTIAPHCSYRGWKYADVIAILRSSAEPISAGLILNCTSLTKGEINNVLTILRRDGIVKRKSDGVFKYWLTEKAPSVPNGNDSSNATGVSSNG